MAAFSYKAVDKAGAATSGLIEASSAPAARAELRARSLLPLSVQPTKSKSGALFGGNRVRGIGGRALTVVTRQLATLIGAGLRIEDALKTVADQAGNPRVASLMLTLRADVLDGQGLAPTLDGHPHIFGAFYRASVRAGEASGKLGEVMDHLADFVETRSRNRQTVQLALLYPAILAVVSLGVIVALLVYVVPDIVRVFTARGAELPLLTRSLIATSDFVATWGLVVLGVVLGAGGLAAWALSKPRPRLWFDSWMARAWPMRHFVLKSAAVQFAGTLATLTVSRVPLTEALEAASDTIGNRYIRARTQEAGARVREGTALSQAMHRAGVFPPLLVAMVSSGEAGGTLGPSLTRAASDQSRDLDALVSALVALVEPAVLLIMGGVVMLLVLSILLPIVNLNNLVI
ncbi:type II secretion system F family protein [Oceaniovalibus sp. ACAM 378]|uniref:type II secretion system F family protein n=1 Tax=Oceaniovalibus sp. ACAM 378 TaxID=2599923 RepID=UPI0011D5ED11|nr:type II secretion system F family protein [Oceaniovalibus sp. ACAM 378]TYB83775.1 type II secretion system protein GspF [Oceaniovalibus sp. ACAM 378]